MIGKILLAAVVGAPAAVVAAAMSRRPLPVTVMPAPMDEGITVTGEGEVEAPPDIASLHIGVSVQAPNVAEARQRAAGAGAAVIASVKANGVAPEDIQTLNLSIQPVFDYRNGQEPRITAYTVSNTLVVRVRAIDSLSRIVDDAAEAGGDATRIDSIAFAIADSRALIEQARAAAVADARKKAEQLASAAGVTLGAARSINEYSNTPVVPMRKEMAMLRAAGDAGTPIEAGTNRVHVGVNVRYAIVAPAK